MGIPKIASGSGSASVVLLQDQHVWGRETGMPGHGETTVRKFLEAGGNIQDRKKPVRIFQVYIKIPMLYSCDDLEVTITHIM